MMRVGKLAMPLGVAAFLSSTQANAPRYFIERLAGSRQLGLFAAMSYFMVIGSRVVSALGESARPRMAMQFLSGDSPAFRGLYRRVVAVGVGVGLAGVLVTVAFGKEILEILYSKEYAEDVGSFVWLMVAAAISYVVLFLQQAMTATHSYRTQPRIMVASLVVTSAACFVLVPGHGNRGAAIAMILGLLVQGVAYERGIQHALSTSGRRTT
jgi:O-antigen/teichoic acid export membrane protein